MRMNIMLILLISINGISCLKDGMSIDSLPTYSNYIVTIQEHGIIDGYPCSGTIISPSHIVTTGYCVHNLRNYEIYVIARGTNPNQMTSIMVNEIHRHHDFRKVYDSSEPHAGLWLNNIAILQLVLELPGDLNIVPLPLNYQRWNHATSMECYIIGYNPISMTKMIPQWSTAVVAPNSCLPPQISRLPHEIFAVTTSVATYNDVDRGNSLIYNGTAIGMIVDIVGNTETAAVLIFAYYQDFIEYIIAGGVAEIGESAVHVVVAIFESGEFRCGGFVVHNHYIVTAAHCVEGRDKANLLVAFSHLEIPRMNPVSEWSSVESIEVHPLYPTSDNRNAGAHSLEHNIAILKLKSDLPWNPSIRLKDLPDLRHISADRPCEILRWTDPSSGDAESKILTRSYVKIYEGNQWIQFGPQQFRAEGFYELPIATHKDIGNPIIFENNIIGMAINIVRTVTGSANLVTCLKIRPYEAFIRDFMNRA